MESTKETCLFEHAIGFKRIPWAFFEKMHFEKFKFLFWKYLDFKKYLEDLKDVKFNSGQLLFSAPNWFFNSLSSYRALKKLHF